MKTKKTTIAILATLAFGIAAAQAGRGCILTVPDKDDCQSQTQHASRAVHTFDIDLGEGETYVITGITSNLTTMDASSIGTLVEIRSSGGRGDIKKHGLQLSYDLPLPKTQADRKTPDETGGNGFTGPITLSGPGPITITFNFVHSASTFGSISLDGHVNACPTASGDLETTAYANADDKPHLKWNAKIRVKGNDSSPGVGNETNSSQRQAPNAGKTKTNNGKGNNK